MKGFLVLQFSIAKRQERESEQMMNLHSEDAINFKARNIALASALKINWQTVIDENRAAVRKQISYHHS